jgi:3-dehydroquinate synthase
MIKKESIGKKYAFSGKAIDCFFNAEFSLLDVILESEDVIFITDENVFAKHATKFIGRKTIVIKAGEKYKNQKTVDDIIDQLIGLHADRNSLVVGVGGGVVTDISGFAASLYMRGIKFGFVPASILGMVDASIGGKNGVDVGIYKNLVGTINHPQFLLYDYSFLKTLPEEEWISGFAEIIKHACIRDKIMFEFLETKSLSDFQSDDRLIGKLIEENVNIKYNVVSNDEHENGERKLLNFGHTIGHAIENISGLSHGKAISVGMALACIVSEKLNGFSKDETQRIISLLTKYKLPVSVQINKQKTWEILLHDKKRFGSEMNFIVLNKIGKAEIKKIPLNELEEIFYKL